MSTISIIKKKPVGFAIYKNIPKLFRAKGIELINYSKMNIIEFNNKREANGFFVLEGKKKDKKIWVAFVTSGSKYMKAGDLNNYIGNITADEYYVITDVKKNIKVDERVNLIDGSKHCIKNLTKTYEKRNYHFKILSDEEKKTYIDKLFLHSKNIFPGILIDDSMIVWSQAKLGDLVEITYPTLTSAGMTGTIREVIKI